MRADRLDALGHPHRVDGIADVVEQDHELVAAESGERIRLGGPQSVFGDAAHGVVLPHHTGQALRERHQQLIADGVAEAVVHVLEAIEIDEEHGEAVLRVPSRRAIDRASRSMNSTRLGRCVSWS